MNNVVNPYCVLGFFNKVVEGKPLWSPKMRLIPFHLTFDAGEENTIVWKLVNKITGVETTMDNSLLDTNLYD